PGGRMMFKELLRLRRLSSGMVRNEVRPHRPAHRTGLGLPWKKQVFFTAGNCRKGGAALRRYVGDFRPPNVSQDGGKTFGPKVEIDPAYARSSGRHWFWYPGWSAPRRARTTVACHDAPDE